MAKLETLIDAFNGGSLNNPPWTQFTGGSATFTYGATGAQVNFPASTTASTDGDISAASFDLTNSYGFFQVLAVPTSASNADAELRLGTSTNYIRWVYEGGTLFAQYDVAGSKSTPFSVAYNAATHKWWRIREGTGGGAGGTAGNTYWDTSTDGVSWTQRATVADPITVTALVPLIAGLGTTTASSPGTFKFNNFNTNGSLSASIAQVAGNLTASGGTQTTSAVVIASASVTQIEANLTATGNTQSIVAIRKIAVSQVSTSLVVTGGTQVVSTVNYSTISQSTVNLRAVGGTNTVASVQNQGVSQVSGAVTAAGGTNTVVSLRSSSTAQSAATITVTSGTQLVSVTSAVSVTQISASITLATAAPVVIGFHLPAALDSLVIKSFEDNLTIVPVEVSDLTVKSLLDDLTIQTFEDTLTITGASDSFSTADAIDTLIIRGYEDSLII